jgi:predicted small metal-binding protein
MSEASTDVRLFVELALERPIIVAILVKHAHEYHAEHFINQGDSEQLKDLIRSSHRYILEEGYRK